MKNDAAEKSYPGLYWSALDDGQCYPGGESPAQFFARVKAAWLDLKGRARAGYTGGHSRRRD